MKYSLILIIISSFFVSCGDDAAQPKPKAFLALEYPTPIYKKVEFPCSYSFEINEIANLKSPKIKNPIIMDNIGTVEFKIETMALSISNSAKAKKKAGKKLPNIAETVIHFHCSFLIFLILLKPIINKKIEAKTVLNAPNCIAVKPTNPFLISINELPQTSESAIK